MFLRPLSQIRKTLGFRLTVWYSTLFIPTSGRVDIEAAPAKTEVVIVIKDTGIGIPQNDLPRIFDRLFRGEKSRCHRGLGLGLSMVQAVVRAHQGRIEVESKPDEGSTFSVFLPVLCAPGFCFPS
jgi:signal transduction histidine kinase